MSSSRRPCPAPHAILRGHTAPVTASLFLNHAADPHRYLVTVDEVATLRLWDTAHEEPVLQVRIPEQAHCSTDDDRSPVLAVVQHGRQNDRIIVQQKSGKLSVTALSYNPFAADDSAWHATGDNVLSRGESRDVVGESFCRVCVLSDGRIVAPGVKDRSLVVLHDDRGAVSEVARMQVAKKYGTVMSVCSVSCSEDRTPNQLVLVGCEDGTIALWDVRRNDALCYTPSPVTGGPILSLASAPGGHVAVAASSTDRLSAVADTNPISSDNPCSLALVQQVALSTAGVGEVVWTRDGRLIMSAGWDGSVRVWDGRRSPCALLTPVASLRWHEGSVSSVALSSDGLVLASGGKDGTVALWDAKF